MPFYVISDISSSSIFSLPLTISDVPRKQRWLFSSIVSKIIKFILQGIQEVWKVVFLLYLVKSESTLTYSDLASGELCLVVKSTILGKPV